MAEKVTAKSAFENTAGGGAFGDSGGGSFGVNKGMSSDVVDADATPSNTAWDETSVDAQFEEIYAAFDKEKFVENNEKTLAGWEEEAAERPDIDFTTMEAGSEGWAAIDDQTIMAGLGDCDSQLGVSDQDAVAFSEEGANFELVLDAFAQQDQDAMTEDEGATSDSAAMTMDFAAGSEEA